MCSVCLSTQRDVIRRGEPIRKQLAQVHEGYTPSLRHAIPCFVERRGEASSLE